MTDRKPPIARALKITLDIFWVVCVGVLGITSIVFGVLFLTNGSIPGHLNLPVILDLDPAVYSISAPELGIEAAELEDVAAELHFGNPGRGFLSFFFLYIGVGIVVLLSVVYQLRNIMGSLAEGTPFIADNVRRIRFIGWVIIGGEFVQEGVEYLSQLAVISTFDTQGVMFRWALDISATTIFWGCVVLALAEVFRLGVEMREEQALTV